jgi:hypothetical protein
LAAACAWINRVDPAPPVTPDPHCDQLGDEKCGTSCCNGWRLHEECNPFATPPRCEQTAPPPPCLDNLGSCDDMGARQRSDGGPPDAFPTTHAGDF